MRKTKGLIPALIILGCSIIVLLFADTLIFQGPFASDKPATWFAPHKIILPSELSTRKITEGVSLSQTVAVLGKPQKQSGYGSITLEWDLQFGKVFYAQFFRDGPDDYYCAFAGIDPDQTSSRWLIFPCIVFAIAVFDLSGYLLWKRVLRKRDT